MARVFACIALGLTIATAVQDGTAVAPNPFDAPTNKRRERKHTHAESATCYGRRYPDLAYAFCKDECNVRALLRDCRPDDVAARLHTECAGWNEKDPLKRFTDEHRMKVLDEVVDRGVHICTKQGSDEVIRASRIRRRLLGLS